MSAEVRHEVNSILVQQVDSFAAMMEERDLARSAAICLEQELAAANRQINAALVLLESSDHSCCPCSDQGCGDSVCPVCRARVELGGSL